MRTAPTHQTSTPRTARETRPTEVARTGPLTSVNRVPWHRIQDSTGSAAAIPLLLAGIASGDEDTARTALEDLRKRVCQYGFVVEQATAATVPFLWELARQPQLSCRPQIIQLLKNIADARQWENTATAYPKLLSRRENHVVWERKARQAVRARSDAIEQLMDEGDSEIARATTELARALAD